MAIRCKKGRLLYAINLLLLGSCLFLVVPIYLLRLDYYAVAVLFKNTINYERYRLWVLVIDPYLPILLHVDQLFLYGGDDRYDQKNTAFHG